MIPSRCSSSFAKQETRAYKQSSLLYAGRRWVVSRNLLTAESKLSGSLPRESQDSNEQQQNHQYHQAQRRYDSEIARIDCTISHDHSNIMRKQVNQRQQNHLHCPSRNFPPFNVLHRSFSSSAVHRQKFVPFATAMRNSMKPFLLKCHPDVASSDTAKDINLKAVQNLNAFLDRVQARTTTGKTATRAIKLTKEDNHDQIFEVDFCLDLEERVKGKIVHISCRRKVELLLPKYVNSNMDDKEHDDFRHKIQMQLVRLLKAADLKVPMEAFAMNGASHDDHTVTKGGDLEHEWADVLDGHDNPILRQRHARFTAEANRSQQYERSKEEFVSRINWTQYQKVYQQTIQDIQADVATRGLIRDHPQRRKAFVASILSHVRISDRATADLDDEYNSVNHLEQLIALRRLSLLLDEHFDELHLEDLGKLWETMVLVLGPSRHYNTSSSAQAKRRKKRLQQQQQKQKRQQEFSHEEAATYVLDGFAFTLHNDNRVSIQIPIDFQDQELIHQLKRNVEDFYALTHDETMGGIFPPSSI